MRACTTSMTVPSTVGMVMLERERHHREMFRQALAEFRARVPVAH